MQNIKDELCKLIVFKIQKRIAFMELKIAKISLEIINTDSFSGLQYYLRPLLKREYEADLKCECDALDEYRTRNSEEGGNWFDDEDDTEVITVNRIFTSNGYEILVDGQNRAYLEATKMHIGTYNPEANQFTPFSPPCSPPCSPIKEDEAKIVSTIWLKPDVVEMTNDDDEVETILLSDSDDEDDEAVLSDSDDDDDFNIATVWSSPNNKYRV